MIISLECDQKTLKVFAHKRQLKNTYSVIEPSIPFHTLVKLVDTEETTNEEFRTRGLPLEQIG